MRIVSLGTLAVLLMSAALSAQEERRDVFADPQNLEVLPDDISSADLNRTMRGFALGLGVRCDTCHVGEPNAPLHTYDFASDDKAMKLKARVMLQMVDEINTNLVPQLDAVEQADRVDVRCVTCHRGRPQPHLIEDVLSAELESGGIDAAVDTYTALRDEFYGSHSYDFSETTLAMFATVYARTGPASDALVLARINVENFPESYYSHFVLAELQVATGDVDGALQTYARAVELNPRASDFIASRIAAATGGGE